MQHIRNVFTWGPLTVSIQLPRRVTPAHKQVRGALQILCKEPQEIINISYKVIEHFEQSHGTRSEHKTYTLGEKHSKKTYQVTPGSMLTISFAVPFSPKEWSSTDKQIYTGDMALMNKMSDVAKQTVRTYTLEAIISLANEKVVTERKKITYVVEDDKNQEDL